MKQKLVYFLKKTYFTNLILEITKSLLQILTGKQNLLISMNMFIANEIINKIPIHFLRILYLKLFTDITIGRGVFIHMGVRLNGKITIGNNVVIGRNCILIGEITIGNNVSITAESYIFSITHITNSSTFEAINKPIIIEDYAWIGLRTIILPGITLKKGTVTGAGSVITKDSKEYAIMVGVPAKSTQNRNYKLEYTLNYSPFFQ